MLGVLYSDQQNERHHSNLLLFSPLQIHKQWYNRDLIFMIFGAEINLSQIPLRISIFFSPIFKKNSHVNV